MRRTIFALVISALAASGIYALVYLFRWEWHRALITALFFVAAEVGLGIGVLLGRLERIEGRLDDLAHRPEQVADPVIDPAVLARIREAAPPAPAPFAWLDPRGPDLSVFLPFLLGVGALASGLAWGVEQLARRTSRPVLEQRLASRLSPLSLPAGGLLGPDPAPGVSTSKPHLAFSRVLPLTMAALALGLAALGVGVDWLGDALQSRPDERQRGNSTRIDVALRGARSAARPEAVATTLWGTCSHVFHRAVDAPVIRDVGGGRIELVIPTDVGPHAEDRLRGCLQDAVVDRVQAAVLAVEAIPAG